MTAGKVTLPRRALSVTELKALQGGAEVELAGLCRDLQAVFRDGARAVHLQGLDPALLGEDGMASALLRIGGWLGSPSIQSPAGERVARVEHLHGDPQTRGTHSDGELRAHSDLHDILALASVRAAEQGGESFLIPAEMLHEYMRQTAPEHLPALYEGYYWGTNPVLRSDHPVSTQKVPVILSQSNRVHICCNPYFLRMGAKVRGEELPQPLAKALTALQDAAELVAQQSCFVLQPGEAIFWHNWSWLHGRRAFSGKTPRLLLRLWLRSDLAGPVDPLLAQRGEWIDEDHHLTAQLGLRAA